MAVGLGAWKARDLWSWSTWRALVVLACFWSGSAFALDLSDEERAWLASHHTLRVGTYKGGFPPYEMWSQGKFIGMGPEFLSRVATRLGLAIEVQLFDSRLELAESLHTGKVDIAMNISPTFIGANYLRYSEPYADNDLVILSMQGNNRIIDSSDLPNVKVVMVAGSEESVVFSELHPAAQVELVSNQKEALHRLEHGDVDAFVGNRYAIRYFVAMNHGKGLQVNHVKGFRIVGDAKLPLPTLRFAFPSDRLLLASAVDKALSEIDTSTRQKIFQEWVRFYPAVSFKFEGIGMTPEQLNMLNELPALRVSNLEAFSPFSFRNDIGEPSGLVEDYFNLVSLQLQLKTVRVASPTLDNLKALIDNDQVDLIPGLPPTEERKRLLVFSDPYTRFPLVIVTRQETINVEGVQSLGAARVAISEYAEPIPGLLKKNPKIVLVSAATAKEGLRMLAMHEVDAYVGNLVVSDRLITEKYKGILKVAAPTGFYAELAVAVTPKYAHLIPLINKALANISPERRERIHTTWFPIRYESGVSWEVVLQRILPVAILLLFVMVILFVAYWRLRGEINQRIKAQDMLAKQLGFQSALLETIPFPILAKDHNNRYIAVNSAYEEQIGGCRTKMLGRTPQESGHIDAIVVLEQESESYTAVLEGRTLQRPLFYKDTKGQDREGLFWLKPFFGPDRKFGGSIVILVDVTDIRYSEARARASEALLTDVTESLPVTVFQFCLGVSGEMYFSYVAGTPGSTFGMSAESIMEDYESFYSMLDIDDLPIVQAAFLKMRETLQPFQVEFRMNVKNETRRMRASTGRGSRDEKGNVQWGGYFEDVTNATQYQKELIQAKSDAEAADKAKSAFLAMMSHEIRTPVHGILGWLEVLESTSLSLKQRQMLATVQGSAEQLTQVIDDILDFSKLEAGRVSLEKVPVDIRELLDKVLDVIVLHAQKKGLYLRLFLDQRLESQLLCDPGRVRQILLNLLSNALKFTETGTITLRADLIEGTEEKQKLCISVSDTGIGIPLSLQSQLFSPFQQAETSTTRRFGGTGLGLAISQSLANQMQGELVLDSRSGVGTTVSLKVGFDVYLPQAQQQKLNGAVAAILCEDPLVTAALQANLVALGVTVLLVTDLAQLRNLKISADLWFIEEQKIPYSWNPSMGGRAQVIPLVGNPNSEHRLQQTMACVSLNCNPLSWGRLEKLCHAVLKGAFINSDVEIDSLLKGRNEPGLNIHRLSLGDGAKLLIAEDHAVSRDLISEQLRLLGYRFDVAVDGREALQAIRKNDYQLLIADYHMPHIDGLELSRRIRRAENETGSRRLPIIALTASVMEGQAEECAAAGMDSYLRKPISIRDLQAALETFITPTLDRKARVLLKEQSPDIDQKQIDLDYVKDVYGTPERVKIVLRAVVDNMRVELAELELLSDRNSQSEMVHKMASGFGIIKALPMLKMAAELEIGLLDLNVGIDEALFFFTKRTRELLYFLESELAKGE